MLTLSKQSDYSLIIISQLFRKKEYVPLSELINKTNLPKRFLARIAATLVSSKLLISREGRVGGYKLAERIHDITLYEFLSIFEKKLDFLKCMDHGYSCTFEKICTHQHKVKLKLNDIVLTQLKKTRLIDIFR